MKQHIARRRWDLQRFGLTPRKLPLRVRPPRAPGVVSISVPKAGTHLTERILCLHPAYYRILARTVYPAQHSRLERLAPRLRPGQVLCGHLRYSAEADALAHRDGSKALFSVRDPRDVLVSAAHFAYDDHRHVWHPALARYPSLRDRIKLLIDGDEAGGVPSIVEILERHAGWLRSCHVIRYESLVRGESRRQTLEGIFRFLGTPLNEEQLNVLYDAAISPLSLTFRKGATGEWRETFDEELLDRLNAAAGGYLELYGYP